MTKHPGRITCPLCMKGRLYDDFDKELSAWIFECPTCVGLEGGPYTWMVNEPQPSKNHRNSGIMADLGMYDAVVEAVGRIPGRWLEFGVVEALFSEVAPEAFEELVAKYGHVGIHPDSNTASWMIGRATWAVMRDGDLAMKPARPTGRWQYMSGIHAWSLPDKPTTPEILTWADFAAERGHDPMRCWYVEPFATSTA